MRGSNYHPAAQKARQTKPRRKKTASVETLLGGVIMVGVIGFGLTGGSVSAGGFYAMMPGSGCAIKGNVSTETGERIYHVPGQRYYADTVVSPRHGERWFCSEAEARAAGWRRSKV